MDLLCLKYSIMLVKVMSGAAVFLMLCCSSPAPPENLPENVSTLKEDSSAWPEENGYILLQWPDLAIPDYRTEYNETIDQEVNIPLFREDVRQLHGKKVRIKGFFFPFGDNPDEPYYVLSQYAFSQCFFCGAAGPESVMDLLVKEKPSNIKMDDFVEFSGRLKLNDTDVMFLNYILEDATLIK
jgi:hypothetical protein